MPKREELPAPGSPYQQLRKNRQIKVDIHSSSPAVHTTTAPVSPPSVSPISSSFPTSPTFSSTSSTSTSTSERSSERKNTWIKPKNNAVQVPPEVLQLLVEDIERRHAGTLQAEEIVWYQGARSFRESIKTSWATGLSLMLFIVSIFVCVGIVFYAPSYLTGTALIPPIFSFIVIILLVKRMRVDLAGCYALTRNRAIIIVPKRHLGIFKPFVMNFDFLVEKNLIMVQYQEARLQDRILTREPILADLVHDPHATGTVSFYPRSEFKVPFRFRNVQNSHAFELDFSDTMSHTATPVGGGRLKIEKPDFEQQRKAARKYRIYPILGILWVLVIIGVLSGILFGGWYTKATDDKITIAMVILAWFFAVTLSVASVYPIYSLARGKCEAIANARYVKYIVDKN